MKEQGKTKNLGQIAAIWISSNAPENLKLIWYDTSERVHKVYDTSINEWVALNPQVVTNSTISDLRNIAQQSGLSIGKYYFLSDVGTLAVAITTTKIWYVDALNNYVVNDLAATITAYINSDNLLIDGSTGVWNNSTGRLEFKFDTIDSDALQSDTDYVVLRRQSNNVWTWIKTKLSSFVSNVSGNSIGWNKGFYFNLNDAINSIKDRIGGIVGYDLFGNTIRSISNDIENISSTIQGNFNDSKSYTDEETEASKIFNKRHSGSWGMIMYNLPDKPSETASIEEIFRFFISWIQLLRNSNEIKIGSSFSVNGRSGNVNYSDTVRTAIEKLVYKVNNQSKANGITLPSNFNVNGRAGNFDSSDILNELLEKLIYHVNELAISDAVKLPSDFDYEQYSGRPVADDNLTIAIGKLTSYLSEQLSKKIEQAEYNAYYTSGRGDGRAEHNDILKIKTNETGVHILHESTLSFETYEVEYNALYSGSSNDDSVVIIRDIPDSILTRIGNAYGYNVPFNLNVPVTGSLGGSTAHVDTISRPCLGTLFAILVQPPQDDQTSKRAYLKLIPYWTHGLFIDSMDVVFAWDGVSENATPSEWGDSVRKIMVNVKGDFGSYAFWNYLNNDDTTWREELISVSIPKFSVIIPC